MFSSFKRICSKRFYDVDTETFLSNHNVGDNAWLMAIAVSTYILLSDIDNLYLNWMRMHRARRVGFVQFFKREKKMFFSILSYLPRIDQIWSPCAFICIWHFSLHAIASHFCYSLSFYDHLWSIFHRFFT